MEHDLIEASPSHDVAAYEQREQIRIGGALRPDRLVALCLPSLEPVMRPSMEAAASRKNALLFDFELEATRGIVDWGRGI